MNILHIIPNLKKGGAERICLDICNELIIRDQINVKLVVLSSENEYPFLCENLDIQVINTSIQFSILKSNQSEVEALNEIIKSFKPDIIHTHLYQAEILLNEINEKQIPSFFHIHDNIIQFNRLGLGKISKNKITNFYERFLYLKRSNSKRNISFLCISKNALNFIKQNIPTKKGQPIFFPNAINFKRFSNNNKRDLSEIRLVSIGSLVPKKGHSFLIDVIFELKKISAKTIHLDILGDGILRDQLDQKIQQLELKNEVKLNGKVDFPEQYLEKSNLYIHGATYEPFGLVLIEAMASGLPVICVDGKGNRDLIKNNYNGFLFGDIDAKTFARKIVDYTNDESDYSNYSENAVKFAAQYDIVKYVDKLLTLYQTKLI